MSYNSNSKINAGAVYDFSRDETTVRRIKANDFTGLKVRLDVTTIVLDSFRCKVLFLPNGIIVKKGFKIVAYSYDDISIVSSTTRFIEKGFKARDAEVIDRTWQYVNKNGTPDER